MSDPELTQTIEETSFRNLVMVFLNETNAISKEILANQSKILAILDLLKSRAYPEVSENSLDQLIQNLSSSLEKKSLANFEFTQNYLNDAIINRHIISKFKERADK